MCCRISTPAISLNCGRNRLSPTGSTARLHRTIDPGWVERAMCDRDPVSNSARDRELAAECERLADLATDDNTKAYYRELAAYYLERARSDQPCN